MGENIKRVMSEIFLREDILSVPGSIITILEADISPDAKSVKIFVEIFGNEEIHDKIIKKLNDAVPHFRYKLAKKVALRTVPDIKFSLDKTGKNADDLESLINSESKKISKD